MADALNRQYIQNVNKIKSLIPPSNIDPLIHYERTVGRVDQTFTFCEISMGDLNKIVDKMKPTGSQGEDDISMRIVKDARQELQPHLLLLVNQAIRTKTYPNQLKTTKIVPIEKKGKMTTSADSWRPVNVVPAISKILERVLLQQMLVHLEINKLVKHNHHGAIKGKSTQTIVIELYDKLMENMTKGDESILILLDQSKAYEIVDHDILIRKLKAIGFKGPAIDLMKSFLSDRKQYVQIQAMDSEKLLTGPQSVVQGSTVSCILFLIYVLDLPQVFHEPPNCPPTPHTPQEQVECPEPNAKTFVDDEYILITRSKDDKTPVNDKINQVMEKVATYTQANKLALNQDKTLIMLVTKNKDLRKNFQIELGGKRITHQKNVKILGNIFSEDLSWDNMIQKELIPSLKNRARTLKLVGKYMSSKFKKIYAQSTFKSKIIFGSESWGGSRKTLIEKIQTIQNKVIKYTLGPEHHKKSTRQMHKIIGWLPVLGDIEQSTFKMTHKILNSKIPEEISEKMPMNLKSLRIGQHRKLDKKPKWLNTNKLSMKTFRSRAYHYNTLPEKLTQLTKPKDFKKDLKSYLDKKWN